MSVSWNWYGEWISWVRPRRYNWVTVTPVHIEFEWAGYAKYVEVTLIVLGLGFYVTWWRESKDAAATDFVFDNALLAPREGAEPVTSEGAGGSNST